MPLLVITEVKNLALFYASSFPQGRRCRQLLDDLKERRGYSHLKEEALDRTIWRAHFGRGFGPVVRHY
jgi:hypothetical protein